MATSGDSQLPFLKLKTQGLTWWLRRARSICYLKTRRLPWNQDRCTNFHHHFHHHFAIILPYTINIFFFPTALCDWRRCELWWIPRLSSVASKVWPKVGAKSSWYHRTAPLIKNLVNALICTMGMGLKPVAKGQSKCSVHCRWVFLQGRDVFQDPSFPLPMALRFGRSLEIWCSLSCVLKEGKFNASKRVGFGDHAPRSPCARSICSTLGKRSSNRVIANLQIEGLVSSSGSCGCSRTPKPEHMRGRRGAQWKRVRVHFLWQPATLREC